MHSTHPDISLPALLAEIDEQMSILVLIQGTLTDGNEHFAYLSIPPSRYEAFKQAEASGPYQTADFGQILAEGAGVPSEQVMRAMKEQYGAEHQFESDLLKRIAEIQQSD